MKSLNFNPETEVPDLSGKVFFITGGTAGIGAQTALHLAKHNASRIYISGRNSASAKNVIQAIKDQDQNQNQEQSQDPVGPSTRTRTITGTKTEVIFVKCDLTSLASVKDAAAQFLGRESRLDVLICCAGIMATDPGLTKDGYEVQFGTNHLGHAMLVRCLLPLLQRTAGADSGATAPASSTNLDESERGERREARIIILTSLGYKFAQMTGIRFDELNTPQDHGFMWSWFRYGQSKLANLLYAKELGRRYPGVTSVAIHPGVVGTNLIDGLSLGRKWFTYVTTIGQKVSVEEGCYNCLWAASTDTKNLVNGGFYEPVGVDGGLDCNAKDEGLAGRLWEWTEWELDKY